MKFLTPSKKKELPEVRSPSFSIGTGNYCNQGVVSNLHQSPSNGMTIFIRRNSSFLRVADLNMPLDTSDDDSSQYPNFHHVSSDPPEGIQFDENEQWVALNDGSMNHNSHAPMAPAAVQALAQTGMAHTFHADMWKPDGKTLKYIHKCPWHDATWVAEGTVPQYYDDPTVLVWSGSFKHKHYGHELPAIRAAGFINKSPEDVVALLMDSTRVKEYNKLSLGREDLFVLQDDMDPTGVFGGMTKVCKSQTKPPLIKKTLEFTSILHARERPDGFKLVTRAVHAPGEKNESVLKSEILLGVNLIKRIEGEPNKSLMITVNHIRSPCVPMMIAKRIGLQAANNFFQDLR